MTLIITLAAAVITTVIWYSSKRARELNISMLMFMFWGAGLMWLVDAVVEYLEDSEAFFNPAFADMVNDTYLGISVEILALVVWSVRLLISDPKGVVREAIKK